MVSMPYGKTNLDFEISHFKYSVFQPPALDPVMDPSEIVKEAFKKPLNDKNTGSLNEKTIAIGINDQTRPIPNHILIPELIEFLLSRGAFAEKITFYIATGTHQPVANNLVPLILNTEITSKYRIVSHDCDDLDNLEKIGTTTRNIPVLVNKTFYHSDLKIVVGNIESHHFMGFSGGYKTAAIGLASRETITANHALLSNPKTTMGLFSSNPMRQEVEDIGRMLGVDFALNGVINPGKDILACYWGPPKDVILEGINFIRQNIQLDLGDVMNKFDLVIASPGGYPKDINFYQAQKAITHACLFAKPGGKIILVAECSDGPGSDKFEHFIKQRSSFQDVMIDFENQLFEIGPHKAYQLAKQALQHEIIIISNMPVNMVEDLMLKPAKNSMEALEIAMRDLPQNAKIAFLPYATHTMPKIFE